MNFLNNIKVNILEALGDNKSIWEKKRNDLKIRILNEYDFFIGQTDSEKNLQSLLSFFIKRVGFDEAQSLEVIKMSGIDIDKKPNNNVLSNKKVDEIIDNAAIFSYRNILK